MIRLIGLVGAPFALICVGCSTAPNVAKPAAPVPVAGKHDSTVRVVARHWALHRSPGSWRYRIESNATVVLAGDSTAPSAPIHSTAIYSLGVDTAGASGGFHITGRVDSLVLAAGGRVPSRPVDSTASEFTAQIDSTSGLTDVTMGGAERSMCAGGVNPVVVAGLALFVSAPANVEQGSVWHDSTSMTTCRGNVAVVSKLQRTFELVDTVTWNGQSVLRVNVTAASAIAGEGLASAAGDSISVTGTGTSSGTLLMDPTSLMPVSSTTTGTTAVTVHSRQTTLPFKQQVTETVTLLEHHGLKEP
ncbi:MAG TPA: hypothetical protein VJO52_06935 [Gemmatimonadaceae bacterium]|nr:hypothetical protein [Gemmatimonadaceae bacterium]